MQANLQRGIRRTQARRCCWVTAQKEEASPSASGLRTTKVVSHACGKPVEQRYFCGARREADAGGDEIFSGRLGSGRVKKLTGSGSEIDDPLSTA